MTQWHFAKRNIFTGKVAWNSYLTHGLRHNCVIDQSATENKVIHTLIIDFFSHGLRSVKIEQELEKSNSPSYANFWDIYYNNNKYQILYQVSNNESEQRNFTHLIRYQTKSKAIHNIKHVKKACYRLIMRKRK